MTPASPGCAAPTSASSSSSSTSCRRSPYWKTCCSRHHSAGTIQASRRESAKERKREKERHLIRNPENQERTLPFLVSWIPYQTVQISRFRSFALSCKNAEQAPTVNRPPPARLSAPAISCRG